MSIIQISVDTESKMITANIDGTDIGEISDFSAYKYRCWECCKDGEDVYSDKLCISLTKTEKEGNAEYSSSMRYVSANSEEAKMAKQSGIAIASELKGFVKIENSTKAKEDILNFFSKK